MKILLLAFLSIVFLKVESQTKPSIRKNISSKTIIVNSIPVDIIQNDSLWTGDILVLPGWNFSRHKWCDSTDLCVKASALGYRLILPEMGESVYSSRYFLETRSDLKKFPTLLWVTDTLIPLLQKKYNIFSKNKNFILGLSTGARGALLIALKTNALFKAGAALSGDYDQTKIPNDNLMTLFYGSYKNFSERWITVDNPVSQVANLKTAFYLGHGKNDKIVPFSQTQILYDAIRKTKPDLKCALHLTNDGHNFKYWRSETDTILTFFENSK